MTLVRRSIEVLCVLALGFPVMTFAAAAPFANTASPTFVTEKSAKLNGTVNSNDTPDTTQWFEWGISGHTEVYETSHNSMWTGTVLVNASADIYGLAPSTSYFYRQVAENSHGKTLGATTYFTTKALPNAETPILIVQTNDATSIGEKSAVLKGYVSPHGNMSATWWFEWGETSALGKRTPTVNAGWSSGTVQATVTNLQPGTKYYFRLAGENSDFAYGNVDSFVTQGVSPVVPTSTVVTTPAQDRPSQIIQLQSQIIALLFQVIAELQKQISALKSA